MRVDHGTKREIRKTISDVAKESLADHELIVEQNDGPVRMWYCGKKGTGIYSFRVISAPYALIVYGDVGDCMVQASDRDLIPWLKGAVASEQYLIGKMVNKKEVFLPDEADYYLDDLEKDFSENDDVEGLGQINNVRGEWDKQYDGYDVFCEAMCGAGFDSEMCQCAVDNDSDVYWSVECLRKFVSLLSELEPSPDICSSLAGLMGE